MGTASGAWLAKTAAEANKPFAAVVWTPADLPAAYTNLELEDLPGAGPQIARGLVATGLATVSEIAAWAQQHLSTGTRVVSDGLACFNGVSAAGCSHDKVVVGSGKAAVERPAFRWVNTNLGNVENAVHGTYHAIHPK